MQGEPLAIAIDVVTAVAGVWLISAAVMGYSVRPLGIRGRAVYGVVGAGLLIPVGAFAAARWLNIAGVAGMVVLAVWERSRRRAATPSADTVPATASPGPEAATPADRRALLDRMGIRGSGDAE
jgi:hypothetical protein